MSRYGAMYGENPLLARFHDERQNERHRLWIIGCNSNGRMPVQAKELLDHMEGVLSNQPVEVVQGNSIVEVKPQGVSKGAVVDKLLIELSERSDSSGVSSSPDFVLCIGDDRSDEDMFRAVEHVTVPSSSKSGPEVLQSGLVLTICSMASFCFNHSA